MSLKRKLSNALKTLRTNLDDALLVDAFNQIQNCIDDFVEEEASSTDSLPIPDIANDEVAIYSDGACRGNPGPGSWAFIAQDNSGKIIQKASGVSEETTNNRMELQGAIEGLEFADFHSPKFKKIFFYTDSKYVVDGITTWVNGWKARGWKKADKKAPENLEQWQRLDELKNSHNVQFIWVKGHAGHPQNELCDKMANEALDAQGF